MKNKTIGNVLIGSLSVGMFLTMVEEGVDADLFNFLFFFIGVSFIVFGFWAGIRLRKGEDK